MFRLFLLACVLPLVVPGFSIDVGRAEMDRIASLPEVSQMPDFAMYSGYLPVSTGKEMHYWLNTCEAGTCNALIVWFNGGPGCSSMDGLLTEHGPFKFDANTGQLITNQYSWNKFGHTLYIESPGGVGFSVDTTGGVVSDDTVAQDTLRALLSFFEKFPSLSSCDLYISGESYAGVYIPVLVNEIMSNQPAMARRIKGIMIGNGLMSSKLNDQSLMYYAYYHGLFGEELWNELIENCCVDGIPDQCNFYQFRKEECVMQAIKANQIVLNGGLNMYNLYQDCAPSEELQSMNYFKESRKNHLVRQMQKIQHSMSMEATFRKFQSSLGLIPPCSNATFITEYLNRPDVQQAIHVRSKKWEICSDPVHSQYKKIYLSTSDLMKRILSHKMDARVLLYYGDVDMACNHLGGEWYANQLGMEVTMPRKTWNIQRHGTEQVAGFVKEFDKLTFATVKGAGHMVPVDKPEASFQMIQRFMDYEPF